MAGGGNWMIFKVPFSRNQEMILWFSFTATTIRSFQGCLIHTLPAACFSPPSLLLNKWQYCHLLGSCLLLPASQLAKACPPLWDQTHHVSHWDIIGKENKIHLKWPAGVWRRDGGVLRLDWSGTHMLSWVKPSPENKWSNPLHRCTSIFFYQGSWVRTKCAGHAWLHYINRCMKPTKTGISAITELKYSAKSTEAFSQPSWEGWKTWDSLQTTWAMHWAKTLQN